VRVVAGFVAGLVVKCCRQFAAQGSSLCSRVVVCGIWAGRLRIDCALPYLFVTVLRLFVSGSRLFDAGLIPLFVDACRMYVNQTFRRCLPLLNKDVERMRTAAKTDLPPALSLLTGMPLLQRRADA